MSQIKKKLIEVALPLEAINAEAAREKSIRHGHPSTLHLWWARRPLAAARAILFAQLVDDPSSHPDKFRTEEEQSQERLRLFDVIKELIIWENAQNAGILDNAREEIKKSFGGFLPTIFDPFAGGGSIPLEAQRLGLGVKSSDLNPVPVLINKAMLQIPFKWSGRLPISPGTSSERNSWQKASGLSFDVRYYGNLVKNRAEQKVAANYPDINENNKSKDVIAWLWIRTVRCPNPACGIEMPLLKTWWLSKRLKKETWLEPIIKNGKVSYAINHGKSGPKFEGTVSRTGAICVSCGATSPLTYIRSEANEKRMGQELVAVVIDGPNGRNYVEANEDQSKAAKVVRPNGEEIDVPLSTAQYMAAPRYGMTTTSQLFTNRQLSTALTFVHEINGVAEDVIKDAKNFGMSETEAKEYANAIKIYLTFALDKGLNLWSMFASWMSDREALRETFPRQAISMVWDFAEPNPFGKSGGSWDMFLDKVCKSIEVLPANGEALVEQKDARLADYKDVVVSTDPPYYDNVPYADLSDYFYPWLRATLRDVYPELFQTLTTPKFEELVADHVRLGGKKEAAEYFEDGFRQIFNKIVKECKEDSVTTVYYAFKQSDTVDEEDAQVSTGWETILKALIDAGLSVTATWPVRTEGSGRIRSTGSNALATSMVLACRKRASSAETMTRRTFISTLKNDLPIALQRLQESSIAPVDLAQAAIGPGIAIYSEASRVLEVDGSEMSVRTALAIINQTLDEVLSAQESDFDADTRFCLKWFTQYGWNDAPFGEAEGLARAMNTSIPNLERGGIFKAAAGKARLLEPSNMSEGWDPAHDKNISVWEVAARVAYALQKSGQSKASDWLHESKSRVDIELVKELSYLLFSISEKRGWNDTAIMFNGLGTSWNEISIQASNRSTQNDQQGTLDF